MNLLAGKLTESAPCLSGERSRLPQGIAAGEGTDWKLRPNFVALFAL